ncbi:MAG TPA: GTP cyclohydrolase I [Candidatus Dormibacteraeota bacterium]|nr:GTP cyclohydrolase I [Candidatus Dormibacteraeota bacterium]
MSHDLDQVEEAVKAAPDRSWVGDVPREVSADTLARLEGYAAEIFATFGMEMDSPSTKDTPRRFIQAMADVTRGYEGDPKLLTIFPTECRGGPDCRISQIVEGPIPFFALCEHHALPFYGFAHVAYIAHEHIVGLSKLTRLVNVYARRFTVQERVGQEVADWMVHQLKPHGVAVHLSAIHMCTRMRGVRDQTSRTSSSYWRGAYEEDPALRQEFLVTVARNALG